MWRFDESQLVVSPHALLRTLTTEVSWNPKLWVCFWDCENVRNDKLQMGRSMAEGLFFWIASWTFSCVLRWRSLFTQNLFSFIWTSFYMLIKYLAWTFLDETWTALQSPPAAKGTRKCCFTRSFAGCAPCFSSSKRAPNLSPVVCTVHCTRPNGHFLGNSRILCCFFKLLCISLKVRGGVSSWEGSQPLLKFLWAVTLAFYFHWTVKYDIPQHLQILLIYSCSSMIFLFLFPHSNKYLLQLNILWVQISRLGRRESLSDVKFSVFLELSRLIRPWRSAGSLPFPLSPVSSPSILLHTTKFRHSEVLHEIQHWQKVFVIYLFPK